MNSWREKWAREINDVLAAFGRVLGDPISWLILLCFCGPYLYLMWLMGLIG